MRQEAKTTHPADTLVAALIVLFILAPGCGPGQSWEETMAAGQQAYAQGHYGDAERMFSAAVDKAERFGREDPRVAHALSRLAQAYVAQRKLVEAEPLYLKALTIYQAAYGEDHPDVAATLNNLGVLNRMHGQFADAEPLLTRALTIKEKVLGPDHPELALTLKNLAMVYTSQEQYGKAELFFKRVIAIQEKSLGPSHKDLAKSLEEYAILLRRMNRGKDAEPLEVRAQGIRTGAASQTR